MGRSLWITIISIGCTFYGATSSTVANQTAAVTNKTTTDQGDPQKKNLSQNIIIYVPVTLVLLAAIIIPVLVVVYRRRRGREILAQESICYGNSEVFHTAEHNVYKLNEKEKDDYKPKPSLTPKEEPIYINVQGNSSLQGDQTENIYCNVGYNTQH